ncbi:FHA domain-containing protein [Microbacterium album]|uniref:FHA domain-containing protein n=1 Tax=Microbacterium album TaxID=2053191 RepID=A0A917IDN8_9MICO|nr:FHA domain-containing protein [Microbacterium album]GGH42212.1 hypothetical protein GCM10010921_15290 [Microbacterium album]
MAKPHKFAWNGVDIETALSVEQVANMAQRAAHESTGDLWKGKQRIVSTRSSDREIEFRVNDFLISFKKYMVFLLTFTVQNGRTYATTSIEWYLTSQPTVGGFVPVGGKSMVAHHTYMQFAENLAGQVRAADATARIGLRTGVQTGAPAAPAPPVPSVPPVHPASGPPFIGAPPSPPPPLPDSPPPPPPPPPPRPSSPPREERPAVPAPAMAQSAAPPGPALAGLITGLPGAERTVLPPAGPTAVPSPPVPPSIPGATPLAAQQFAEDDDLEATRASQSGSAPRPWTLHFSDGQRIAADAPLVFGRAPVAPESHPQARALPVNDPWKSISKTHALLDVRGGMLWVTDLQSTNGTSVTNLVGEATECPAGVAMPVGDGWAVTAGQITITARLGT